MLSRSQTAKFATMTCTHRPKRQRSSTFTTRSSVSMAFLIFVSLILSALELSEASMASPHLFEAFNEDGSSAGMMRVVGNPREHYTVTEDGYTVCSKKLQNKDSSSDDADRETWFYCESTEDGDLKPRMDLRVGSADPQSAGTIFHQ